MRLPLVLVLAIAACSSSPRDPRTSRITADDAPQTLDDVATQVIAHLHRFDPARAVELGLHDYDGQLPDRSPAALEQMVAQLDKDREALRGVEAATEVAKLEREVLLQEIRKLRFSLVELDTYRTNPMAYSGAINLDAYIIRDYAPLAQRAAAIVRLCNALPAYLSQARTNLRLPMPRPWIDTALLQTRGLIEFADHDVRAQLSSVEVAPALDTCKRALTEHAAWLAQHQNAGTAAFALGKERYLQMLADTQGVELDLPRLEAIAKANVDANHAAILEAARAIDPRRDPRATVLAQAEDKPGPTQILEVATQQAEAMRKFVVDKRIVSIPSSDVAIVRESPPFQRWNAAFLDRPGPFETKQLPSYYYISPPDPKWPTVEQRAYIIPRNDLLFTTIHEVWPGHFLHGLHIAKHPSRVLRSFCTFSNSEGWAHYTEEMMFEAGAGDRTPQARIGMLKEALLRDVRFVVALGEHTGGMTVEQATKLFESLAFVDPGNARQQAVRGTFDPMYLAYTLGKLMVKKLRDDWMKKYPGRRLDEFHDKFLSYACAPVPVIRRMMLGDDAGPPL